MKRWLLVIAVCGLVPLSSFAAEGAAGALVARDAGSDRAVAGGRVTQSAPVAGDLLAAGGEVDVSAPVGGDAVLAGGKVRIRGPLRQGLYAAGGRVSIDAPVGRNVRAAGGAIELGPAARVAGNASLAAGRVRVLGPVDGYLDAAGGSVVIDAAIGGDVDVMAGSVALGPNAAIAGRLRYATDSALVRDPAARVAGTVERRELGARGERRGHQSFGGRWVWVVGLMVLAALVAAVAPVGYGRALDALRSHPAASVLVGFVALVCLPVLVVLLLVTIVGAPLALLILFAYPVLLLLGYVTVGVAVGAFAIARLKPDVAQRRGWRAAAAAAAVLAIGVVTWLPWLGTIVAVVLLLAGTGAVMLALRHAVPVPRGAV